MARIKVSNRQRAVQVRVGTLQIFADAAVAACLKLRRGRVDVLAQLGHVHVVLVSDRRIAQLHRRFLGKAGATDVVTFHHGEIIISVETARRQARAFRSTLEHELCLYIVHGLLHLGGFDDKTAAGAAEMKRIQEKLVASLL